MALKQFNPTSPAPRQLVLVDRSELHKGKPVKALVEGLTKTGGRGDGGRIAVRFRGGGAKRLYRMIDFKRRKWDVAAHGRAAGVRPQPHRLHRPDQVRRRRAGLHPGPAAPRGRRRGDRRREGRREAGQRPAAAQHADRHDHPQRRAEAAARAARSPARPAPTPSWSAATPATPRSASARASCAWCRDGCMATVGAVSNPDHMNKSLGKAGRVRSQGPPPARARRRHEPGRPPARRRRGQDLGRPSPGHPVGQADQGPQDPHQQGDGQVSSSARATCEEGALSDDPLRLERPVRRRLPAEEGRGRCRLRPQGRRSRPGRAARPSCRSSSA